MHARIFEILCAILILLSGTCGAAVNLSTANVYCAEASRDMVLNTAVRVLTEEVEKRCGLAWPVSPVLSDTGPVVVLELEPALPPEGYSIAVAPARVTLSGADGRGVLYAVGRFLRVMRWEAGTLYFPEINKEVSSPAYPLRGHQLGYRFQANSYDTWDDAKYEQYIRELVLFGCNSIENIPFQDDRESPHMPLDRRTMNRRISEICHLYGLNYWVWTPAEFDLSDTERREAHLAEHQQLYEDCPELTGVFFPGGDPGANPPERVLPFMEAIAGRLRRFHPDAKVWLSLQWFNAKQCDDIYSWIDRTRPDWFGGLVAGPGSPPAPETRARLTDAYPVRLYPDITHTVRCEFPVPWWDPAFSLTLGREPINPQPVYYAFIHNYFAPFTAGFITYSDGINDDLNKTIWSMRGWDPTCEVRTILVEYARFFFNASQAEHIADGILALEKNWEGSLAENGAVAATLTLWQDLEETLPGLADNWRWQALLVRAYYDAYTRERLLFETGLENEANTILAAAKEIGTGAAMDAALEVLNRTETEPAAPGLRERIVSLYDGLFHSIGLKSSVKKYQASGYERGCSLDFLEYPLNNRWFLEDEFNRIRTLPDETERARELATLAAWACPSPGSFYDDIGHPGKSPHLKRLEGLNTDPYMQRSTNPGFWWWEDGFSRRRLSWQNTMDCPMTMVYTGLDPKAAYLLRMTGNGEAHVRANGYVLAPTLYNKGIGELKEFPIPKALTADRTLTLLWECEEQSELNWRDYATIAEVWLLKQ